MSEMDLAAAEKAARMFLEALGIDLGVPATSRTPERMAHAYAEMLTAPEFEATTFPNNEGYSQFVIENGIPFRSLCEHHFLSFVGFAHIGYLPGSRILGLSKLARVVEKFAGRAQTQERLTQQIADWLEEQLSPQGVGVVLVAEHLCMTVRGVRVPGAKTVTSALHGDVLTDPRTREEFFSLTGVRR